MRIMVDANIIISAGLFPESNNVFKNKFPERTGYLNNFVKKLKYELVDVEIIDYKKYPKIRDNDDIPLLACANRTVTVRLFG